MSPGKACDTYPQWCIGSYGDLGRQLLVFVTVGGVDLGMTYVTTFDLHPGTAASDLGLGY